MEGVEVAPWPLGQVGPVLPLLLGHMAESWDVRIEEDVRLLGAA
jgi:hypothetical protein